MRHKLKTLHVLAGTLACLFSPWVSVKAIDTSIFTTGTLFIEAEDADFGHGKYVTDKKIGVDGPYDGGSYAGLGTPDDAGFDWHSRGPDGQTERPHTGLS